MTVPTSSNELAESDEKYVKKENQIEAQWNPLKTISINLQSKGPLSILVALICAIVVVSVFAPPKQARDGLNILKTFGLIYLGIFSSKNMSGN